MITCPQIENETLPNGDQIFKKVLLLDPLRNGAVLMQWSACGTKVATIYSKMKEGVSSSASRINILARSRLPLQGSWFLYFTKSFLGPEPRVRFRCPRSHFHQFISGFRILGPTSELQVTIQLYKSNFFGMPNLLSSF